MNAYRSGETAGGADYESQWRCALFIYIYIYIYIYIVLSGNEADLMLAWQLRP